MKYLIVDLNIELNGHKYGFIDQLIQWIDKENLLGLDFTFYTNKINTSFTKSKKVKHIVEEQPTWQHKMGISRYTDQWKQISKIAISQDIDYVLLMEFDIYQAELGKKRMLPFQVSGIWFRPFVRQQNLKKSAKEKLTFLLQQRKKRSLFAWSMRNQSLRQVFILNDQSTVDQLNNKYNGRLEYLADPIFEVNCTDSVDIRSRYGIEKDKIIFLLFGCIDERKNVENTIKAIENLSKEEKQKVCLLIVGKVMPHFAPNLEVFVKRSENEGYQLLIKNEFVSDCEMDALFQQSDLSLRMNVNFFGSSGIIGFSAKYNKPSVVSHYGIVAELTKEYEIGSLVNPTNITEIKECFSEYLNGKKTLKVDGQSYFKQHNVAAYAKALLNL